MKSIMYSALMMFALATTGCAIQGGGNCSDCGILSNLGNRAPMQQSSCGCSDCGTAPAAAATDCGCGGAAQASDCGCGAPTGNDCGCSNANRPMLDGGLVRKLGDSRGMGLRLNEKGFACNDNRGSGLFSRIKNRSTMASASVSMGDCDTCEAAPMMQAAPMVIESSDCGCETADCGCEEEAVSMNQVGGLLGKLGANGGCKLGGCKLGGCKLGECKLGGFKLGGCKLSDCCLGNLFKGRARGGAAAVGAAGVSGCGVSGCGVGGALCRGCMGKRFGHPYGGAIPHTAQGPGAGTGPAPSYAYPYYTTRGPRDFLMSNPPSIGY